MKKSPGQPGLGLPRENEQSGTLGHTTQNLHTAAAPTHTHTPAQQALNATTVYGHSAWKLGGHLLGTLTPIPGQHLHTSPCTFSVQPPRPGSWYQSPMMTGFCCFLSPQAEFLFGKNVGPVPGRLLPPHPKNANISLTLSHTLLDAMETHITKQSTFQVSVDHRACTALCGLPEVDVPVGSGCPSEINQQMATQVSEW